MSHINNTTYQSIVGRLNAADARADLERAAEGIKPTDRQIAAQGRAMQREAWGMTARDSGIKPGDADHVRHPSVQHWSQGEIFPAVIAKVEYYIPPERYSEDVDLEYRRVTSYYELILDGVIDTYATYADARDAALFLINPMNRAARDQRNAEGSES